MAREGMVLAPAYAVVFLIGKIIFEGFNVFDWTVENFGQPSALAAVRVSHVFGTRH